jgi:hypothetical protein
MSAFANIIINDGAATPVAHTFSPVKINADGVASLADRSSGISIGFPLITLNVRPPVKGSRVYKVTIRTTYPILEATSPSTATGIQPAPTVAYTLTSNTEFILPERSSLLDRTNLLALHKNLLANTNVSNAVLSYEAIY